MAELNFNRAPYFDDYNSSSNHVRVLFRDGVPIQTRELNNIQSAMQDQFRMFGEHVFKNGALVSGGRCSVNTCYYVAIEETSPVTGRRVPYSKFNNWYTLRGQTTRLLAKLVHVESPSAYTKDRPILYLSYIGTAIDGETRTFLEGELIDIINTDGSVMYTMKIQCPSCNPTSTYTWAAWGKATMFVHERGVYFYNGMFVTVPRQQCMVSYLMPAEDVELYADIGFDVYRKIITPESDATLFDNSLGYPNKTNAGADRYQVKFGLTRRVGVVSKETEFIPLARWAAGKKVWSKPRFEYNVIEQELARRTYEESGNYTVKPYDVLFMEELNDPAAAMAGFTSTGSESNFVVKVTPTIHYVNGTRVENLEPRYVIVPKARSTRVLPGYAVQFDELAYVILSPQNGTSAYPGSQASASVNDGSVIELYNGPINPSTLLPTGTKIGSMKIMDMRYESGTIGSSNAQYRYYIYDLKFNAGQSFSNVESVFQPTTKFLAVPVFQDSKIKTGNLTRSGLIWRVSKNHVKSMRDAQNSEKGSVVYTKRVKLIGQADSAGVASFLSSPSEMFSGSTTHMTVIVTTNGVPQTINHNLYQTTISPNSLRIDLGTSNSAKTVEVITDVVVTKVRERTKKLNTSIDSITVIDLTGWMNLSKCDVLKITNIVAYNKSDSTSTAYELKVSDFEMNNGQTDVAYGNGTIKRKSSAAWPDEISGNSAQYGLRVTYEYFEHSSSSGFINVDSYNPLIQEGVFTYQSLPAYKASNGQLYALAGCFDFRPLIVNGLLQPSTIPSFGEMGFMDLEYYLPRIDMLQVDTLGDYRVIQGQPDDTPKPAKALPGAMPLCEIHVPAFVYDVADVRRNKINTKRYTMKDIGRLNSRLKNVEYYTSLNLLETSARDFAIRDANGYDKFKNGFVVDDFTEFQAADLESAEFKAGADVARRQGRPKFGMRNRRLRWIPERSVNTVNKDGVLMCEFSEEVSADSNLNATKSISVNPYHVFTKVGAIKLEPALDTWSDTYTYPDVVMNQDFGSQAYAQAAQEMDSVWGSWKNANTTVMIDSNGVTGTVSTAQYFDDSLTQADQTDTYDLGTRLTDARISTYIRANIIKFTAQRLAPGTRVYPFFENKPVWQHCRPDGGLWGADLVSDANGNLVGYFKIPAETFYTGEKKFKLTGSPINSNDPDTIITTATATYYAAGMTLAQSGLTLNVVKPVISADWTVNVDQDHIEAGEAVLTVENGNADVSGTAPTEDVVTGTVELSDRTQAVTTGGALTVGVTRNEPVAQSFMLDADGFISSFDVYFETVDLTAGPVWFEIRTVAAGVPTTVVLEHQDIDPSAIPTSATAQTPFRVTPKTPIFVKGGAWYAIVVGASSPRTRLWVSKIGDALVDQPGKVMETQVSLGSSFRSQNGSTWSAEQWEDLKYEVRVAKFDNTFYQATFEIEDDFERLDQDPFETQAGSSMVRVYAKDHGCTVGDTVTLYLHEEVTIKVLKTDLAATVNIGDMIFSTVLNGSVIETHGYGTVIDYSFDSQTSEATVTIKDLQGIVSPNHLMRKTQTGAYWGIATETMTQELNGINIARLNSPVVVTAVDSKNTFVFNCGANATVDGRAGGTARAKLNIAYDAYNVSGSYMMYGGDEAWDMIGIAHNHYLNPTMLENYRVLAPSRFKMSADNRLYGPQKLVTEANYPLVTGGDPKTRIVVTMQSPFSGADRTRFLCPTISADSLSITVVSNRVSQETVTRMNIAPLASNRWAAETHATDGVESYKYVTKPVRLTQPCEDILLMVDVNREPRADFKVYYRSLGTADARDIRTIAWTEVPVGTKVANATANEFTEYEVYLSKAFASTWASHDYMSAFQFKLVGVTENSSNPPLFKNLRIIAVT